MFPLHDKLMRPVTAAIFVGSIAWAAPALATGTDAAPAAKPQAQTAPQGKMQADAVEARIAELHKKLGITAGQEAHWAQVTQVMRDNAKENVALIAAKRKNEATMTASEDLHAYAEIAQTHADHAKKLADAFDTLYATMSDSQKKTADQVFREHKQRMMRQQRSTQRHQS